jgi:uncharacterized membrane protein YhhN
VTAAAVTLAVVAAVCAVLDWWAVAGGRHGLEYLAKPAATAALVGVAATIPHAPDPTRLWLVGGLIGCLAGDVCLMVPPERWDGFVPGLAAFLLAHVAFTVGFVERGVTATGLVIGAVLVAAVAAPLGRRFVRALHTAGRRELIGPVLAYLLAIAAMATTAVGAGNPAGIAGAWMFLVSDSLIAETRFVGERRGAPVAIMVTYHLALAGLVASLLG